MRLNEFKNLLRKVRDEFMGEVGGATSAQDINRGLCADYATIVWERSGGNGSGVDVFCDADFQPALDDWSHVFLKFKGKYFDAECVEGANDWRVLPCFQRSETPGAK